MGENVGSNNSKLLSGFVVTVFSDVLHILERVGREISAHLLNLSEHLTEAIEVLGMAIEVTGSWEVGVEEIISELTVGNLSLKSSVVLSGWVVEDHLVKVVEFDVSGVNMDLAAGLGVEVFVSKVDSLGHGALKEASREDIVVSLEVSNRLSIESSGTELLDW